MAHAYSNVDEVTEAEREGLREAHEYVYVASRRSECDGRLHIPADGYEGPLCSEIQVYNGRSAISKDVEKDTDFIPKSIECYPLGYCDWCLHCVATWRGEV